jgi:hypothetical protein
MEKAREGKEIEIFDDGKKRCLVYTGFVSLRLMLAMDAYTHIKSVYWDISVAVLSY